jgi:glucose/arabinose dehydrogenase
VTLHGSWNRPVPVGYAVIRIPFDKTTRMPTRQIETIFSYKDLQQKCQSGGNANYKCFRPAGLVFKDGLMYISSAATGEIVRVMKGRPADVERDPSGNGALSMSGQAWGLMTLVLFSSWMAFAL